MMASSYNVLGPILKEEIMWKSYELNALRPSVSPWKRVAKRLRSKYRHELAMEKAAHAATKQALIAMVRELAESIGQVDDAKWDHVSPKDVS